MRVSFNEAGRGAIFDGGRSDGTVAARSFGGEKISPGTPSRGAKSADDGDWFAEAARCLYPTKAGSILYLVTQLGDERLCQRYAAGDVRPPAYFLRRLLRGDHGELWRNVVMSDCTAQWWLDERSATAMGRHVLDLKK